MKKIKMGLMALAGIIGIGGVFAFRPAKQAGVTYYAKQTTSGNFQWVTTPPSLAVYQCKAGGPAACTITSTYDVTGSAYNSTLPAGATEISASNHFYQPK